MGAYSRLYEWWTERQLAWNATRGMVPPAPPASPIETGGSRIRDRRKLVPPLGLREYWYPALPARRVPRRKPLYWRMLGDEVALFRTKDGSIGAISDICPHRGAAMSKGFCFFKGTVSCPYHGATFDETGECKAFIPEGPKSQMVNRLKIKTYPTKVLRGWVFLWMGEGEPVPIEEDVPPELFEDDGERTHLLTTYTYWRASWILAIENQGDAHNYFYAHRNSLMQIMMKRIRPRTPIGARSKLVNGRALLPLMTDLTKSPYVDESGEEPFQLYYSGVNAVWPTTRWRQWVWAFFKPWSKIVLNRWRKPYRTVEEWAGNPGVAGWHMPCMVRVNGGYYALTRFAVPVTDSLSRIIYFHHRPKARWAVVRLMQIVWFYAYFNWWFHYNFSSQDGAVAAPCRYWADEDLSSTDSHLVMLRKLVTEGSRDVVGATQKRSEAAATAVAEEHLGLATANSLAEAAARTDVLEPLGIIGRRFTSGELADR
ncbi:MAG TPA: Rieske 2Fe-2S domain-containing protein [Candidatus Binataceae bacterium]|nr:Rieske 2Fe-2S domain-containing protein [Candidatus Binataceae bacterium]